MKRLIPGLCCALLLSVFGPVPSASAHWWSWHNHGKKSSSGSTAPEPGSKSKPPKKQKAPKEKKQKHHREKTARTDNNGVVTTPGPRSVGWWHKQPGPAGAGAN
jgi:hypothetical protein